MIGSAKNMELAMEKEYNENSNDMRNIKLIYFVIALWMHANNWAAGVPAPYPR